MFNCEYLIPPPSPPVLYLYTSKITMFSFSVVSQIYTVNLLEESVLRGNAAIFKCHISTFVTEYVSVSSWIISEGDINELEIKAESNDLGTLIFHRFCCNYYIPFFPFLVPTPYKLF